MIPQRIVLRGFLCYRDEQEVHFDGSSLWLLAGLNGSGKSAVFDGVTYALFGYHRGGNQNAIELINHQCTSMSVDFDFSLDGKRYQIRRTLTRKTKGSPGSTQQIYLVTGEGEGGRVAIEGTERAAEFKNWVRDNIGLSFDTFTSSVLLRQGEAEKLISAAAADRFKVLAGIVDLDRFRKLHERADDVRKKFKAQEEMYRHQFDGLDPVSEEQVAAVEERITQAEQNRTAAQTEVDRLQGVEQLARQWTDLQARRAGVEKRWRDSQSLVAQAEAIREQWDRLRELREVLPHLERIIGRRRAIAEKNKELEALDATRAEIEQRLAHNEAALGQALGKTESLRRSLVLDEQRLNETNARLLTLTGQMGQVKLCEKLAEDLTRLERQRDQGIPFSAAQLDQARRQLEAAQEARQVLPQLVALQESREQLRQTQLRERELLRTHAASMDNGRKVRQLHDTAEKALKGVQEAMRRAAGEAVKARTLLEQAKQQLDDFGDLAGAKLCRHCGQALTPQHYEQERQRRRAEFEAAQKQFQQAEAAQREAGQQEHELTQDLARLKHELTEARAQYAENNARLEQIKKDVTRLGTECGRAWREMPEPYAGRVGVLAGEPTAEEWVATTWPAATDVTQVRGQAGQVAGLQRQVREAETKLAEWQRLQDQVEHTRANLTAAQASLPERAEAIRSQHTRAEGDQAVVQARVKSLKEEQRAAQADADRLGREKGTLERQRAEVDGKRTTATETIRLSRDEINNLRRDIPATWQHEADTAEMGELFRWRGERDRLEQSGVEQKYNELQQVQVTLETLRRNREELATEGERYPEEARCAPEEVQRRLVAARQQHNVCQKAWEDARYERGVLESRKQQRQEIQAQLLDAQRNHSRYDILTELLGRNRLQRYLVRQAERQVVDHANAVLDRLSSGQLYLRLRGGEDGDGMAEKALELEAFNRSSTQEPINVAFLSGSQRFRVAVSLALGLGQYASKQHRPIQSVIIDEGFGCLDRQGRQVMIQELQNLRGQLRCILLVSHQEEFVDAFADGYRFEMTENGTRVSRFQR